MAPSQSRPPPFHREGLNTFAKRLPEHVLHLPLPPALRRRRGGIPPPASQAAHWVRDNKLRAVGTVIAGYIALQIAGWLAAYASQLLDPAGALGKVSLNDEAVARAVTERNGGAETLLLFATVAFIGPIVEEFFFRQFLIDFLDQYIPGWASLTISSALFGVYHMHALTLSELINVLPHMSLGIVFSTVYVLTKRNIIMSSAVHIANNLPALALFL